MPSVERRVPSSPRRPGIIATRNGLRTPPISRHFVGASHRLRQWQRAGREGCGVNGTESCERGEFIPRMVVRHEPSERCFPLRSSHCFPGESPCVARIFNSNQSQTNHRLRQLPEASPFQESGGGASVRSGTRERFVRGHRESPEASPFQRDEGGASSRSGTRERFVPGHHEKLTLRYVCSHPHSSAWSA